MNHKKQMQENQSDKLGRKMKLRPKLDFGLIKQQKQARYTKPSPNLQYNSRPCQADNIHDLYQLHEKLGEGATGTVYRCTSKHDGRQHSIKVVRIKDEENMRIAVRSFNNLSKLHHPNIIKAVSLLINEPMSCIYTVFEALPGYVTLSDYKEARSPVQAVTRTIIEQLVCACEYMHRRGVSHRDIKPENILVHPESLQVKLIDFDVSKAFTMAGEKGMWTVTGTLAYKAPEIYRGMAYSQKVDLWAVGVVLYEMLEGHLPFQHEYQFETIEAILNNSPDYDGSTASRLAINFMQRLLKKDPEHRVTADQARQHPWLSCQDTQLTRSQLIRHASIVEGVRSVCWGGGKQQIIFSDIYRMGIAPVKEQEDTLGQLQLDSCLIRAVTELQIYN